MPLVSSSIPNLVNGVSQQPATLRLASQAEIQENGLSSVAEGLKKRPPTKHLRRISDPISDDAFIHTINRDAAERYIVIITEGDLKVYDTTGNPLTVNFPDGKTYLSHPSRFYRAVTVADYTFILNTNRVVNQHASVTPSRPYEALVVVKSGQYGKTYSILLNGVQVSSYTTPDGSVAEHANDIATDHIASQLMTNATWPSGFAAARRDNVIQIINNTTNFDIEIIDGYNGAAMAAVKGTVQRFSDLPGNAKFNGFTVKVEGDVGVDGGEYYVRFERDDGGPGVWREVVSGGVSLGVANPSMPHVLVREADGTFTFRQQVWGRRVSGDMDSNPDPTFVGRKITDVFFYRNRLGFLSDENVILSEAGEFFNFYRTTVAQLLDSDPVDVAVSHTKVSILRYAVPFNKELLLFSDQTQFILDGGDLLTPRTVTVKPSTEFEMDIGAEPKGVGRYVYFAVPRGDWTGIREYYVTDDLDTEDAALITAHVPRYIPRNVYKIAPALNEDFIAFLTKNERNVIYAYKFYWSNNEKLQSSWSKWTFPATDRILNVDFIQSDMYMVINRNDGLYLEVLNVSPGQDDEDEPYPVLLDRKVPIPEASLTYDSATFRTYISMGWVPDDGNYAAIVAVGQPKEAGILLEVKLDGNQPYVDGNYSDCDLIVGRRYFLRYVLSPLMIRSSSGQGSQADTVGRLQIRNLTVNFDHTGDFQIRVTPFGRQTYVYQYTGKILGVPSATLGQVGMQDGQFTAAVQSRNTGVEIEISTDSPITCAFLSIDWTGYYTRLSQAV